MKFFDLNIIRKKVNEMGFFGKQFTNYTHSQDLQATK